MKACALTGHRPEKLPFGGDESDPRFEQFKQKLLCEILRITREGVTTFISGMARGVDIWAAETVLSLKAILPSRNIKLWVAIPYDRQSLNWTVQEQARYQKILEKADKVEYVSHDYFNGCLQKRNRYMIDAASHLIAVYDGVQKGGTKYTIDYARKKGIEIIEIQP